MTVSTKRPLWPTRSPTASPLAVSFQTPELDLQVAIGQMFSQETEMMPLGNAPALMTVSADEPPRLHVALAFYIDEPHRLRDEVVAQELPGRTRDLDLV